MRRRSNRGSTGTSFGKLYVYVKSWCTVFEITVANLFVFSIETVYSQINWKNKISQLGS